MINAMENLLERRSIRKYKSDPIPQDVLDSILEAGTYAATGMNR
ncbi:MAG: nitroreductase family protein, partial [bacterium]|nr:nitroreductase family protein [bacterium]